MKTHRSTHLFLCCSGGERSAKGVRPAWGMEASKEEQRGLVRFVVAENARIHTIKSKLPGMLSDGIILLHDNARPHTANLVNDNLKRFGWETLQNPPYNPDLSACDIHIFGDLKKDIPGRRFHWDEQVQEWVRLWIHQRPTSFYKTGIDRLLSHLDKFINTSGNYFWIKQIPFSLSSACSVFIFLPLI